MHLVAPSRSGPSDLGDLVAVSEMGVYDLCRAPELRAAAALMAKYADTPMDFADATIVLLVESLGIREVFTLDHRGFSVYRTRNGRALTQVLEPERQ
jgi:uncharacterized protein